MINGGPKKRVRRKTLKPLAVMGWLLCFLALFFLFQTYALRPLKAEQPNPASGWFKQCSAGMTAAIWRQWYPLWGEPAGGIGSGGGSVGGSGVKSGEEADLGSGVCGWLIRRLVRKTPYYRYIERNHKKRVPGEIDPAYAGYLENHEVLEEYEYLVNGLSESVVMVSGKNPLAGPGCGPEAEAGSGAETGGKAGEETGGKAGEETGEEADKESGTNAGTENFVPSNSGPAGTALIQKAGRPVVGVEYIPEQLADYDFLMKHFYTVHPTTTAGRDMMKAKTFLSEDLSLPPDSKKPQILIYHTHSQEEFSDFHQGNPDATIVSVGSYLTSLLTDKGYGVIHDTSVYDLRNGKLDRSKAYTYALDGVTGILQKYPSIQVVLDIHRDGVKEGTRLVQEIGGKPTATIMFFNGTSQSPAGPIEYLQNPYRTDNMAFSFQMKLCADAYYPGFTRKIYLKGLRYNMQLRPRSALIEVGAQTNTSQEAKNAMEPLADLLDMVLKQ